MTLIDNIMIKANELRIGNWYFEFGMPRQATGLLIYKLESIRIRDKIAIDISPIPLTPEILEKAGFREYGPFSPWLVLGSFAWVKNVGIMYEIDTESAMLDHIIHLHQLQNLYFALTGEELNITL
jgi:hypothetical protein